MSTTPHYKNCDGPDRVLARPRNVSRGSCRLSFDSTRCICIDTSDQLPFPVPPFVLPILNTLRSPNFPFRFNLCSRSSSLVRTDYRYISEHTHIYSVTLLRLFPIILVKCKTKQNKKQKGMVKARGQSFILPYDSSLPHDVPRDRGDNRKSGRNRIFPPEITTSRQ